MTTVSRLTSTTITDTERIQRKDFVQKEIREEFNPNEIQDEFRAVQSTFFKYTGGAIGIGAMGILLGSFLKGAEFPAKALRVIGDAFGAVAAIAVPFLLGKNEVNDYNLLKHGKEKGISAHKNSLNELLYRSVSIGFLPYIFEPLISSEKTEPSKVKSFATVLNIPNLIFTGCVFGLGNFNSIISWILRTKEQFKFDAKNAEWEKLKDNGFQGFNESEIGKKFAELELTSKRKHCFNQLYDSTKRFVEIGSIALPAMHGLRRFAEAIDFTFKGELSFQELIGKPFTALSRSLNLLIGLPEVFAKGFDSVARIAQEKDHLKSALPKFLLEPVEKFSKYFDNCVSSSKNNILKSSRNVAEIIFHTLSPISQLAFIAPILDQKAYSEEAKVQGGAASVLDRVIGTYGKASLLLTTLPYIFISRFPQALAQSLYFARYFYGKKVKKESDREVQTAIENIQGKICDLPIIKQVSEKVESFTNHIVPDYIENEFPSFVDIQVNYSFAQAEELFKKELQNATELTVGDCKKNIIDYCLEYVERSAARAYQKLSSEEMLEIKQKIETKIEHKLHPEKKQPRKTDIKFPGAYLLAHFLRPFNYVRRIKALATQSPFHRMETAYNIDEIPTFRTQEFLIVLSECASSGLRNTVNRLCGVSETSQAA